MLKRIITRAALLLLAALIVAGSVALGMFLGTAFADGEVQELPEISEEPKSLTIIYQYKGNGIEGVRIAIYRVADVTVTRGRVDYHLTEAFEDYPADWQEMSAEDSIIYAKSINVTNKTAEQKGTTDADGKVVFEDLTPGMYLIVQTEAAGEAAAYEKTDPYLLAVPMAEDGAWVDQVAAYPKTELKPEPETPTPVTGEDNMIYWLIGFCVADLLFFLIVGLVVTWKRMRKE